MSKLLRRSNRPRAKRPQDKPLRDRNAPKRERGRLRGALIGLCALLSLLVAAESWASMGEIRPGVKVGNVPVGGMTRQEARALLEEESSGLERIALKRDGRIVARANPGVRTDVGASVERAYSVGRDGGLLERLAGRSARVSGTRVEPTIRYDREAVRNAVENLERDLRREPRNASVSVEGGEVTVSEAQDGYRLDVAATLERLESGIRNLDATVTVSGREIESEISTAEVEQAAKEARAATGGEVILSAGEREWRLSPARIGETIEFPIEDGEPRARLDRAAMWAALSEARAALNVEPVEASYELSGPGVSIVPGRSGRRIEERKLLNALEKGIFEGRRRYEIPVVVVRPDLTTAEARTLRPTTVLGEYKTDYTWDTDPGRRTNMQLASSALSGTTVAPGEVFSYNAVTEPLDYEEAKVIEEGAVAYAEGGGLSQVSSTLFMAANYAGLEIIEAHPHSAELPYIPPGLDTTVWFGALDLRFRNDTEGYILIEQWQGADGYNHARIWGQPTGRRVEIRSEKTHEDTGPKGRRITRYAVSKTITRGDEVLFDGVFRRVTYRELDPYDPENE
ncbi:MAG: peptidoglycan binding domain-containing protein [Actinomycetota bacterium]